MLILTLYMFAYTTRQPTPLLTVMHILHALAVHWHIQMFIRSGGPVAALP